MREHNCIQCNVSFISNSKREIVKFCCKKCADNNYIARTKEKKSQYDRQRHLANPEINRERVRLYKQTHKQERYAKEKIILDGSFSKKFYKNTMTAIKSHFRSGHTRQIKSSKKPEILGYTYAELKERLLSTMPNGYTWDDYIKATLHIDHIKPHSKFKYDSIDCDEFKQCWSLNNLRLLEATKNIKHTNE